MGAIKRNIPNFITCLNLVCGFLGIIFLFQGRPTWAVYAVFFASFFDFIDGLTARLLKVASPIGKDLDSLADVVTFGVLPGLMLYQLFGFYGIIDTANQHGLYLWGPIGERGGYISFIAVLIPVFSAIRLAKFNNDTEQGYYFKGLATPASGLFITCSFFWIYTEIKKISPPSYMWGSIEWVPPPIPGYLTFVLHPVFLISTTILLSVLLVCNLKLMAFKFKGFGWKANQWKYIFLAGSLLLIICLKFAAAPIILILYILISQIHFRTNKDEI
jgi:CDP-diacylglycerol--serine O-phosphatidyltransferase